MRILWIVNTIFPYPAMQLGRKKTVFGGWLNSLAEELVREEKIELAIATIYDGKTLQDFSDEHIKYYLIPGAPAIKYNKKMEKDWIKVNNDFKPDIVHIHGTEYTHGLAYISACPDSRNVIEIQGMTSIYAKVYYANLSLREIIKNITIRDIIKRANLIQNKREFENRGKAEIELIRRSKRVIGRTMWDYANTKAINPQIKYYKLNEMLRKPFYENVWNLNNIEKHSIFCSQASYPIKGFHYMLEALVILKQKYPDVKLYVSGNDIIHNTIKMTGYGKILKRRIKKDNLEENVIFTGVLNEEEMAERLLKANVFVLPSSIENSSNSLGEAMLLGMPCVASNTGGTMDMIEHKKEGFVYPYTEPAILAEYISTFFEEDVLSKEYGHNARETALKRHDLENNRSQLLKIYEDIMKEEI